MKSEKCLFCLIIAFFPYISLSQGLKFQSAELPINERTSYSVFQKKIPAFSDKLEIEFDMQLYPISEIGYILRLKNHGGSQIYNLFFDGRGDNFFKLNEEGKYSLITAKIDLPKLISQRWFKMSISFDLQKDSIRIRVDGKEAGTCAANLPDTFYPEIVFGRSEHIIDVPSFSLKNLRVGQGDKYFFPLSESKGNDVHNLKSRKIGYVINPDWLINDSYYWKEIVSFRSMSVAGSTYNPKRNEIYYFNRDTLWLCNVLSGNTDIRIFEKKCPVDLTLGMNFLDSDNDRLYAYEVYSDVSQPIVSVASLDLNTYEWRIESHDRMKAQLHHHSCSFNSDNGTYTIFGGFGNMRYSRDFYSYSIKDSIWSTLEGFSGDPLYPRYFSSMGYMKEDNSLYVFGGMGNESGEQAVGRIYLYDLYKIDCGSRHIYKLWEIPWTATNSVPVREMIIPDKQYIYTLCYPESVSDSHLNLYKFSISDGTYQIIGDSIPIHSDKITTNANIYYDLQTLELYATVQEFDDDIKSKLKVYSIIFPPITEEELAEYANKYDTISIRLIFGGVLIFLLAAAAFALRLYFSKKKNIQENIILKENLAQASISKPNSIFLFGDLLVRNKNNRNITYMFTGKQEQTFIILLKHTLDGGITSRSLSTLLWPDRPEDKAKNIRGVTINHLRKTLQEFDGIELAYSDGRFSIKKGNSFYCDYLRCMEIISSKEITEKDKNELLGIVLRGKFLQFSTIPMYDSFKEEMDSKLEPILQIELEKNFTSGDFHRTITVADALFNIDSLNENALSYQMKSMRRLKMEDQAYMKYQMFISEYKRMMGTEYPNSFKSIS